MKRLHTQGDRSLINNYFHHCCGVRNQKSVINRAEQMLNKNHKWHAFADDITILKLQQTAKLSQTKQNIHK